MSLEQFDEYDEQGGKNYEPVFRGTVSINPDYVVAVRVGESRGFRLASIQLSTGRFIAVYDKDVEKRLGLRAEPRK